MSPTFKCPKFEYNSPLLCQILREKFKFKYYSFKDFYGQNTENQNSGDTAFRFK